MKNFVSSFFIWYFVLLQISVALKYTRYVLKLQKYYEHMQLKKETEIVSVFKWIQILILLVLIFCLFGWTFLWVKQSGIPNKTQIWTLLGAVVLLYSGVLYANFFIQPRPLKILYQNPLLISALIVLPCLATYGKQIRIQKWIRIVIGLIFVFLGTLFLTPPKNNSMLVVLKNVMMAALLIFGCFLLYTIDTKKGKHSSLYIKILFPVSIFLNLLQVLIFRRMNQLIEEHVANRVLKNKRDWQEGVDAINILEEYFLIFQSGVVNMLPVRPITNPLFLRHSTKKHQIVDKKDLLLRAFHWQYNKWGKQVIRLKVMENYAGCIVKWKKEGKLYLDVLFRGTRTSAEWARNIIGGINVYSPTDKIGKHSEINRTAHLYTDAIRPFLKGITTPVRLFGHSRGTVIAFMTALQLIRISSRISCQVFLVSPPGMFDPDSWILIQENKQRLSVRSLSHSKDIIHQNALLTPFGMDMFGEAYLTKKDHTENPKNKFYYLEKKTNDRFELIKKPFWDMDRNTELNVLQKSYYKLLKANKDHHKILYWKLLLPQL